MILKYGLVGERYETFKQVADEYGYRIIEVDDNQTYCTIEDLINGNTISCVDEEATRVDIEFILFINILHDDLYGFIAALKEKGLFFPNKAILTRTNLKWKLRRLLAENKEEHVVMTMFFNLRRSMAKAQSMKDKGIYDEELLELMDTAQHFLNPREFDFDEMKDIHNKLAIKVNSLGETGENK